MRPTPKRSASKDDTVVIGRKTHEEMWAELVTEQMPSGCEGSPSGKGWKTAAEFADERQCTITHAHGTLRRLEGCGLIESQRGRVNKRWKIFYRPIVKPTPSRLIKPILSKGSLSK